MLLVRDYQPEDYATVAKMWSDRGAVLVPAHALPSTGVVIDGVAAGFSYKTDSSIAWIEWIASNPSVDQETRETALDLVIKTLTEKAKSQGFSLMFTTVSNERLKQRYLKHGFQAGDASTELMKVL